MRRAGTALSIVILLGLAVPVAGAERPVRFDALDVDGDGLVDERELYAAAFRAWSLDDDRRLREEEFHRGWTGWRGELESDLTFADWDLDADEAVGWEEFARGMSRTGRFAAWDRDGDGGLDPEELVGAYDLLAVEEGRIAEDAPGAWADDEGLWSVLRRALRP